MKEVILSPIPRHSINGFYCGECNRFVYDGYDE